MHRVEIRIEGRLDSRWMEWFEGFELNYSEAGTTTLVGCVNDQAALYGLIGKLRDLGVRLLAVQFAGAEQEH